MFSTPIRGVSHDLANVLVAARQTDGAHAYYSNGWAIGREGGKLTLPSFMLPQTKFTVIFTVSKQTSKHGILFGKWQDEDKTHFSLEILENYKIAVQKDGIVAAGDEVPNQEEDLPLEGFHVLTFERKFKDLQPERAMQHHGISIGIGGYVLMRGDWKNKPVVYLDSKDVSTSLNVQLEPGEQIIAVKVYKDNFTISTSAIPSKCWVHPGGVPITQVVHWKKEHVNAFYDYTVVFTGTRHK